MSGNGNAAATAANVIIQDYLENGPDSAYCQYVEFIDDGPGGWNPAVGFARNFFCNPPTPPRPPASEFFGAGGVNCRLYQVTYSNSDSQGNSNTVVTQARGPIGVVKKEFTDSQGSPGKKFTLTGGDGINCPRTFENMASSSNVNAIDVNASIISIVALEGDPETEVPVWRPPLQPPPRPFPRFDVDINFNNDGIEIRAPIRFGPVIPSPFGPLIQFEITPTANFNPEIDVDLGFNPSFGLDINLEFVVPLGGSPTQPVPAPGEEPIGLPPVTPPGSNDCEEFDYERIEKFIVDNKCCKPITEVNFVGSFTFETLNQVANFNVPDNTVAVFISITPSPNARVYKLAGSDAEYGHGNASLLLDGRSLGFERLYVNEHVLFFPEETDSKGVRISCGKGTSITVRAGLFIPTVEV